MVVYTCSEARQRLAALLDKASQDGEVRVTRKDGQLFVIRPVEPAGSPLDVAGVDLRLTAEEILQFIQESRRLQSAAG